ncbi:nuclear ribonuclease Z-like [Wolffia australiana]
MAMVVEGYPIEGISVGGQETCVVFPTLKIAFDIGRSPRRAVSPDFLFISHGHMDHIGALPMFVASRATYRMKPPFIFVPSAIREIVERLFELYRAMDQTELKHNLVSLNVGEEFQLTQDLKVRPFRTYHVVPRQGYLIYTVRQKLKKDYSNLTGAEIRNLRFSGVEVTGAVETPEIAFTGDTRSDFMLDPRNADVLRARILIMECTFIDENTTAEESRNGGHVHISEIASRADRFGNKAIILIHFSSRYSQNEIAAAVENLRSRLPGLVFALTEGFAG